MGVNGIYGLSGSGLDIESLVKMGMSGKNKQYDKMEQQEIANTWLKEAYNDVYNDMTVYKYSTLSTYKMQSNMNAMQATSSNSSFVTATANGAAAAMNHTVEVSSVASNAYLQTTQHEVDGKLVNYGVTRNTEDEDLKTSNQLADVLFKKYSVANYTQEGSNYNFDYNITLADGTSKTVHGSDVAISLTLKDSASEDAKEYTLTYTYDELFTGVASGTYTGYTGDNEALFDGGKTLNDFASAIAKTGANIQGGYDTANDSFSLYNKTSGKDNVINITVGNENTVTLFNNLNLGAVDVVNGGIGDRITFAEPKTVPTTVESVNLNSIEGTAQSTSLKDVLGLKATITDAGGGVYNIAVTDKDGNSIGSFTKNSDGSYTGDDAVAFSMNLSNGTNTAEVSFTLGELFDLSEIGTKTSLSGNAGLDEFAAKVNDTGLNVTAKYDAINDSFSMSNPSGLANLEATGSGANQGVADLLINSLNLVTPSNVSYKTATSTATLGDLLGITSTVTLKYSGSMKGIMKVSQDGSQFASFTDKVATFYDGTHADNKLFSFDISDGTNTATIDVTYDDVINFDGFAKVDGYSLYYKDTSGITRELGEDQTASIQSAQNNLSALVDKINAAAESNGLNITAAYNSTTGKFSLINPNGEVSVTDTSGSVVSFASKLNLVNGDPSEVGYKVSSSITRVNTTSTDGSLASILGLTAVKNSDGTLTVKKADGTSDTVATTATAFSLKVGNGTSEETVEFSYADLFDTTGSGTLKGTADFSTLASKLDGKAGLEVAYDASTGKINLHNDAGDAILSGGDSLGSTLVSRMNIAETEASKQAKEAAGQLHTWAGTNASVKIDGKTYDNDTNKLTVAGVTYTFLDTSPTDSTGKAQKATISVSQDTDKIVDYVKSFVEEYNKLLDSLNEKLSEKKYSDYKPLSKRQEDEMTEKQIEKWNEKAKSGLLYHNSDIQALVSAMREAIYTKVDAVDSQYNTLSSIGITTTNTKGHLTLDTDKLKTALAEDPDCVYQLFASDQDSAYIAGSTNKNQITNAQKRLDYANTGIANRLDNIMSTHMKKISDVAGTSKETDDQSYLGKLITNMKAKMSSFKTLMTSYENKLYKRYDAMEVALSKLNMQLGYISGSFS